MLLAIQNPIEFQGIYIYKHSSSCRSTWLIAVFRKLVDNKHKKVIHHISSIQTMHESYCSSPSSSQFRVDEQRWQMMIVPCAFANLLWMFLTQPVARVFVAQRLASTHHLGIKVECVDSHVDNLFTQSIWQRWRQTARYYNIINS